MKVDPKSLSTALKEVLDRPDTKNAIAEMIDSANRLAGYPPGPNPPGINPPKFSGAN